MESSSAALKQHGDGDNATRVVGLQPINMVELVLAGKKKGFWSCDGARQYQRPICCPRKNNDDDDDHDGEDGDDDET